MGVEKFVGEIFGTARPEEVITNMITELKVEIAELKRRNDNQSVTIKTYQDAASASNTFELVQKLKSAQFESDKTIRNLSVNATGLQKQIGEKEATIKKLESEIVETESAAANYRILSTRQADVIKGLRDLNYNQAETIRKFQANERGECSPTLVAKLKEEVAQLQSKQLESDRNTIFLSDSIIHQLALIKSLRVEISDNRKEIEERTNDYKEVASILDSSGYQAKLSTVALAKFLVIYYKSSKYKVPDSVQSTSVDEVLAEPAREAFTRRKINNHIDSLLLRVLEYSDNQIGIEAKVKIGKDLAQIKQMF